MASQSDLRSVCCHLFSVGVTYHSLPTYRDKRRIFVARSVERDTRLSPLAGDVTTGMMCPDTFKQAIFLHYNWVLNELCVPSADLICISWLISSHSGFSAWRSSGDGQRARCSRQSASFKTAVSACPSETFKHFWKYVLKGLKGVCFLNSSFSISSLLHLFRIYTIYLK